MNRTDRMLPIVLEPQAQGRLPVAAGRGCGNILGTNALPQLGASSAGTAMRQNAATQARKEHRERTPLVVFVFLVCLCDERMGCAIGAIPGRRRPHIRYATMTPWNAPSPSPTCAAARPSPAG